MDGIPEKVKLKPSLVIGLGGTGIKTATQIKKDLYEINGNLPNEVRILGFDTVLKNPISLGGWGKNRQPGRHSTGPVSLVAGEYVHIGGNVQEDAKKIREKTGDPAWGKWWNVNEYLEAHIPTIVWNLTEGAGRYRQFGRVALFKNYDTVQRMLTNALSAIQRTTNSKEITIHIIGSLAGGTGAGLYADIAYLSHKIAVRAGLTQTHILGYLALVDAFGGTPAIDLNDEIQKMSFHARCYAALLELGRLQTGIDTEIHYPISYNSSARVDDIQNGKMGKSPYDAVYLFDGKRTENKLDQVVIEEGLAPTIADVVVAQVDRVGGSDITQHIANISEWQSAAGIDVGIPLMGSVGAYSYVLPIYHWVENWSHTLALDLIDTMVPTDKNKAGRPEAVLNNMFGGNKGNTGAAEAGPRLSRAQGVFTEYLDYLWQIGRRSQDANQSISLKTELDALSAESWRTKLEDECKNEGDKTRARKMLGANLTQKMINKEPNENYVDPDIGNNGQMMAQNVRDFTCNRLNTLLGTEMQDGRRAGGLVKDSLDRLKRFQIDRFIAILQNNIALLMNGVDTEVAITGRAGKLGFVLDMLTALREHYQYAAATLSGMKGVGSQQKVSTFLGMTSVTNLNTALQEMEKSPDNKGKRKAYIEAAQVVFTAHAAELARRVAAEASQEMVQVLDGLIASFQTWAQALVLGNQAQGGIYAILSESMSDNQADLEVSQRIRTRNIITDKEYAEKQYTTRVNKNGDQKDALLKQFRWEIRRTSAGGMELALKLNDNYLKAEPAEGQTNAERILELCRAVFAPAWDELSVMDYLVQKYQKDSSELVSDLKNSNGPLLEYQDSARTMPASFLRVHERSRAKAEQDYEARDFLNLVNNALNAEQNQAVQEVNITDKTVIDRNFGISHSQDRFKLTYIYYRDAIQLPNISYFQKAQDQYRNLTQNSNWLHIFSAEQNARRFADKLVSVLEQRPREFDYRVVMLLEDLGLFELAANCLVYGDSKYPWSGTHTGKLLYTVQESSGTGQASQTRYRLTTLPSGPGVSERNGIRVDKVTNKPAPPTNWNLSSLANHANLFGALQCFIYQGYEVGNKSRVFTGDDYKSVRETLLWAMQKDLEEREEKKCLGWTAPRGMPEAQIKTVRLVVARYRKYQAWLLKQQSVLEKYTTETQEGKKSRNAVHQREADLQTILYLFVFEETSRLLDEIDTYRGRLEDIPVDLTETVVDDELYDDKETPVTTASEGANAPVEDESKNAANEKPAAPTPPASGMVCVNKDCKNYLQPVETKRCKGCGKVPVDAASLNPEPKKQPTKETGKEPEKAKPVVPVKPSGSRFICNNKDCENYGNEVTTKRCPDCGVAPVEIKPMVCGNRECELFGKEVTTKRCPECGEAPVAPSTLTAQKVCGNRDCELYGKEVTTKRCPECGQAPVDPLTLTAQKVCGNRDCELYGKEVTTKRCPECGQAPVDPSSLAAIKVCGNRECENYGKEVTTKRCSDCGELPVER